MNKTRSLDLRTKQICLIIVILSLFNCSTVIPFSDEEILKFLPSGSRIAEIPVRLIKTKEKDAIKTRTEMKKGIIYADLTKDGKDEVIVAYYRPPHDYMEIKNGVKITNESFFERARVVVFDRAFKKIWESDGWGNIFGINFLPTSSDKESLEVPWYIFGVKDIDDDGYLELGFSRKGYNAIGDKVEFWGWDGKEFIQKLVSAGELFFSKEKNTAVVVSKSYYAGEAWIVKYMYDRNKNKFCEVFRKTMSLPEYLKLNNSGS